MIELPIIVTFDLNVLVDVYQKREPHFHDSRDAVDWTKSNQVSAVFPGHAVTTLYYLLRKDVGLPVAKQALDFVLARMRVVGLTNEELRRAFHSSFADFENAVVSATAVRSSSKLIVTRNLDDFKHSAVEAVSPTEFLKGMTQSAL